MSLYEQLWNPIQYEPRKEVFIRDLPKNNLAKLKTVTFETQDYKIYEKFACLPYEHKVIQCLNHYGGPKMLVEDSFCRDINNHFENCVKVNHVLGFLKRKNPQHFATSEYSREKPNFRELAI